MQHITPWVRLTAALVSLAFLAAPAFSLSMERLSLEQLANKNSTIVLGTVVDAYSYWNADGTWIVTDFKVVPQDMIKGAAKGGELTVTQLGGTVGEITVLVPGDARLELGKSYVLFLRDGSLSGDAQSKTLAAFTQSVFNIVPDKKGPRAVSQAGEVHLFPGADGKSEAVGGRHGMDLEDFKSAIRAAMAPSTQPQGSR